MTSSESFQVDDLKITLIRSSRRKRLSLEVGIEGVQARAPKRMSATAITAFVRSKRNWINQHLAKLPEPLRSQEFGNGTSIDFQGTRIQIRLQEGSRAPVALTAGLITIPLTQSHLPLEVSAKSKLIKWLKKKIEVELELKIAYYAARMGITRKDHQTLRVRDYKRRWGSCDAHGSLSFNWRLIHAPPEILNYVVVHELAHCLEFNHSKHFWAIVEKEFPNRKQHQRWLKQNGLSLYQL